MPDEEIRRNNDEPVEAADEPVEAAAQQVEQRMQPIGAGGGENDVQEGDGEEEIADRAERAPAGAEGAPAAAGAAAERAPAAAGAGAAVEEPDEHEHDQQILENAQQGGGNRVGGVNPVMDDVNEEILNAARDAGVDNEQPQAEGDPDRAFDTLEDLKRLDAEQNQAHENDEGDAEVKQLRDNVMKLRKGNLYKAVIYAKMLENGEQPADANKELNKELNKPKPGAVGRFSRFVNSSSIVNNSTLDKAGKVTKMVNTVSGLAGMASKKYKESRLSGLITLAADVMGLVNSVRSILKKLAAFKKTNTTVRKKAFAVISIVSDFCTVVSKGAAIAKFVADKLGHEDGPFSKVMNHLSNFAAMAGQITALTGVINTIQELDSNKRQLKKDQEAEEKNVEKILNRLNPGEDQEDQEGAGAGNGAQVVPEPLGVRNEQQEQPKKRHRLELRKKKHLKEKIYDAMERPELTADDKAVLASYLGRERTIAKRKLALANVSHGLISLVLGFGATVSKTTMDLSKKGSGDFIRSAQSALILGGMANSSVLLFGAGGHIGKTATDAGRDEGEASFVKDAFWGTLKSMAGDDKYGLRKVAARLAPENPGEETLKGARTVLGKYDTVTKQFMGSGVNFPKLFEANDVETFKEALAAGL